MFRPLWMILFCITINTALFSQSKPDFFPEEVEPQASGIRCFCEPGIRNKSRSKGLELSYLLRGSGQFVDEPESFSEPYTTFNRFDKFSARLRVPLFNRTDLKILIGYKYSIEAYDLDQIGFDFSQTFLGIDGKRLKANAFSFLMVKSLNEINYLAFQGSYGMNGDYKKWLNFDKRYSVYRSAVILGVKKSEDFEWGPGLSFSSSFRQTTLLPFLLFNKNFKGKWGIESIFPAFVNFRYNLNKNSILLIGGEYNSQSYRLAFSTSNDILYDYAINHSALVGSVQLEKKLASWFWVNLKLGYQANFSTEFTGKTSVTPTFEADPSNYFIFQIGIFLSPPD